MKPLILSTRNIIPTGNKERPVVVRRTWSSTLINVLLGVLLLTFSVLHICVSGVEHTFRFTSRRHCPHTSSSYTSPTP